jgi:hypothetical protein
VRTQLTAHIKQLAGWSLKSIAIVVKGEKWSRSAFRLVQALLHLQWKVGISPSPAAHVKRRTCVAGLAPGGAGRRPRRSGAAGGICRRSPGVCRGSPGVGRRRGARARRIAEGHRHVRPGGTGALGLWKEGSKGNSSPRVLPTPLLSQGISASSPLTISVIIITIIVIIIITSSYVGPPAGTGSGRRRSGGCGASLHRKSTRGLRSQEHNTRKDIKVESRYESRPGWPRLALHM